MDAVLDQDRLSPDFRGMRGSKPMDYEGIVMAKLFGRRCLSVMPRRRPAYNVIAVILLIFATFCFSVMGFASGGCGSGLGGLLSGLVLGWFVVTVFRFFR